MRHLLILTSVFLLLASSCKKKDEGYTQARVIYKGDLTPNGCGYLFLLPDGAFVKPQNLASAFQYDSLAVFVKFYNTGSQTNCVPQDPYDIVFVEGIRRDL